MAPTSESKLLKEFKTFLSGLERIKFAIRDGLIQVSFDTGHKTS